MIANLVVNASKYSPSNSNVFVDVSYFDEKLEIKISDEGEGIKHFDDDGLPSKGQNANSGQGAGLKLTKTIIEELGGTLSFKTGPSGTVATILI